MFEGSSQILIYREGELNNRCIGQTSVIRTNSIWHHWNPIIIPRLPLVIYRNTARPPILMSMASCEACPCPATLRPVILLSAPVTLSSQYLKHTQVLLTLESWPWKSPLPGMHVLPELCTADSLTLKPQLKENLSTTTQWGAATQPLFISSAPSISP